MGVYSDSGIGELTKGTAETTVKSTSSYVEHKPRPSLGMTSELGRQYGTTIRSGPAIHERSGEPSIKEREGAGCSPPHTMHSRDTLNTVLALENLGI